MKRLDRLIKIARISDSAYEVFGKYICKTLLEFEKYYDVTETKYYMDLSPKEILYSEGAYNNIREENRFLKEELGEEFVDLPISYDQFKLAFERIRVRILEFENADGSLPVGSTFNKGNLTFAGGSMSNEGVLSLRVFGYKVNFKESIKGRFDTIIHEVAHYLNSIRSWSRELDPKSYIEYRSKGGIKQFQAGPEYALSTEEAQARLIQFRSKIFESPRLMYSLLNDNENAGAKDFILSSLDKFYGSEIIRKNPGIKNKYYSRLYDLYRESKNKFDKNFRTIISNYKLSNDFHDTFEEDVFFSKAAKIPKYRDAVNEFFLRESNKEFFSGFLYASTIMELGLEDVAKKTLTDLSKSNTGTLFTKKCIELSKHFKLEYIIKDAIKKAFSSGNHQLVRQINDFNNEGLLDEFMDNNQKNHSSAVGGLPDINSESVQGDKVGEVVSEDGSGWNIWLPSNPGNSAAIAEYDKDTMDASTAWRVSNTQGSNLFYDYTKKNIMFFLIKEGMKKSPRDWLLISFQYLNGKISEKPNFNGKDNDVTVDGDNNAVWEADVKEILGQSSWSSALGMMRKKISELNSLPEPNPVVSNIRSLANDYESFKREFGIRSDVEKLSLARILMEYNPSNKIKEDICKFCAIQDSDAFIDICAKSAKDLGMGDSIQKALVELASKDEENFIKDYARLAVDLGFATLVRRVFESLAFDNPKEFIDSEKSELCLNLGFKDIVISTLEVLAKADPYDFLKNYKDLAIGLGLGPRVKNAYQVIADRDPYDFIENYYKEVRALGFLDLVNSALKRLKDTEPEYVEQYLSDPGIDLGSLETTSSLGIQLIKLAETLGSIGFKKESAKIISLLSAVK